MTGISESIEKLTQQLNAFKPVNEWNLGNLKGEVTTDVSDKLSKTEDKVSKLSVEVAKQSKATQDTSSTL